MGQVDKGGEDLDRTGQEAIEGRTEVMDPEPESDLPIAGPHAKPSLVNPEATPGTGSLPDPTSDGEAAAGTG